jgi:hypothetical protein
LGAVTGAVTTPTTAPAASLAPTTVHLLGSGVASAVVRGDARYSTEFHNELFYSSNYSDRIKRLSTFRRENEHDSLHRQCRKRARLPER